MQSFSSADLKARTPTASSSTIRTWAQAAVNFYLEIKAQSNKKAYVSRLVLPQNGYGLSTLIALPCFLLSLSLCLPVRSPIVLLSSPCCMLCPSLSLSLLSPSHSLSKQSKYHAHLPKILNSRCESKGPDVAVLCGGAGEFHIEVCIRFMLVVIKNLDFQDLLFFILHRTRLEVMFLGLTLIRTIHRLE